MEQAGLQHSRPDIVVRSELPNEPKAKPAQDNINRQQ